MEHLTPTPHFPDNLQDYAPWVAQHGLFHPYGFCQCGCGQPTNLAKESNTRGLAQAGEPRRFLPNHNWVTISRPVLFWKKVNKCGPLHPTLQTRCWLWTASTYVNGYGTFWTGSHITSAHRFSYILEHGFIPEGKDICHSCDNHLCVNPDHLWAGTVQENVDDMHAKGRNRQPKGENHRDAKFTNEQVQNIRDMYATGKYNQTELAIMFNVTHPTIRMMVLGKHYRDI